MTAFGYFHGDKFEYTGKSDIFHGALFFEGIFVEGHKTGETVSVVKPPNDHFVDANKKGAAFEDTAHDVMRDI